MSSNSTNNPWFLFGAAVVGIVSAAGVYLAEYYRQEKMRHNMAQDLARMDHQLASMRIQLETLQKTQREKSQRNAAGRKRGNRTFSVLSDDYSTSKEADSSDLEYYDLSSDEEISSRPIGQNYEEIDQLLAGDIQQVTEALKTLLELNIAKPDDIDVLWRIAKASYSLANNSEDIDVKKLHLQKGVEMCEHALQINPDVAVVHKWMAIVIGSRNELQPLKERIQDGYLFKQHVDKALLLDPQDSSLHHMLGRFCFEIASLKWYERKAAATFFAEPPNATYGEAILHCMEAERLCGREWKENRFIIGKIQLADKNYSEGVEWLEKSLKIKCNDLNDEKIDAEIKTLLAKFNSYR